MAQGSAAVSAVAGAIVSAAVRVFARPFALAMAACFACACVACACAGCGGQPAAVVNPGVDPGAEPGTAPSPVRFTRFTVDTPAEGPAFATVADVDGDGTADLVVSMLGHPVGFPATLHPGRVVLYRRSGGLDQWTPSPVADGVYFPNRTRVADVDGDGDLDVIVPSGFLICPVFNLGDCGALAWYEQDGGSFTAHALIGHAPLFYHWAEWIDFDGDGLKDLVTVGESRVLGAPDRAELHLYRGRADGDRFAHEPEKLGDGLGSFPTVADLDGDGDLDVAAAEYFVPGSSFAWLERTAGGSLASHVIDDQSGPSLQLTFVDNFFGDGRRIALGTNHVNTQRMPPDPAPSALLALWPGPDPRQPWHKVPLSDGIVSAAALPTGGRAEAPGIFGVGDIDGDGDLDVLVAGDGDPRVLWLEQVRPGRFVTHVLEDQLTQAGGMVIADLDGDGHNELVVTGYDANVVYVYRREAP